MSKTLLRNNSQSVITLPPPYTGMVAPGDAVVLNDVPSVVSENLGVVPWLVGYVSLSQVPDAQPSDGHDQADTAKALVDALSALDEPLDLNGQRIVNVADPVDAQDAATQQYVIDYVAAHGGGGGGGGGTVTNVSSTNAYLTVANGSSTPQLTVQVGSTANKVAAGDDSRFVDSVPSVAGAVVYDTGAAYSKTAAGTLGQVLKVGAGGLPEWGDDSTTPTGAAGGDLLGSTYPNPIIKAGAIDNAKVAAAAGIETSKLSGLLTDIPGNGLSAFVEAATKVARTYYVSVNGNDLDDGSISKPFATIQAAHDAAAAEYTSGEFVQIEVGPGQFTGAVNISRKNTLIQGTGHRAEMFATKIGGSITVNPTTGTSQYADLVGIAGCWVAPSSATTTPAVKVTGSQLYGLILNDCYLYTTNSSATANALACDATNASRPRILANDCIIKTEAAGPTIVQLDRGDARFNNTQVGHNSGVTLGAAGNGVEVLNNATLWLNNSLVETRTRGSAIAATGASANTKLLLTVTSVTTAYAGAEDTTHGITVSNSGGGAAAFLWQASFSVADTSAAVYAINGTAPALVVYGELSFLPGTNSAIASAITMTPMVEVHPTMRLPSLTASLPLKLDANKQVLAQAISLSGSEVTNTLPVGKGGTGISTTPTLGSVVYGNGTTQAYTAAPSNTGEPLLANVGGAPAFGPLSLSGSAVSGTLPAIKQAPQNMGGDASGTTAAATVTGIQGRPVDATAPTSGQVYAWSGSAWAPSTITAGGGGGGGSGGLTYYLNFADAGDAPLPVAGDKELSLTYNTTAQDTGAVTAPQGSYATLAEFVTDLNQPGATTIPPGNWDIAAYLNLSTGANSTSFRARVFKWDGSTLTELSTSPSDDVAITSTAFPTQYTASVYIEQTVFTATDRLVIRLEITRTTASARAVTAYFGGNTPSHVHTSIGAPGGTGLVKVVDGIVQAPAALLFNADVAADAAIAVSKLAGGTTSTVLHGGPTPSFSAVALGSDVSGQLPVANGGTGLSSGTSGGIPYFSSTSTMASSGLLANNELVLGGGAGATPKTLGDLGTSTKVLHGNGTGAPTWGAVSLADDVSGTLPVANGGTGATSVGSAGSVAYSTGSAYGFSAAGTSGSVLLSGGNGAPTWATVLPYTAGGTGGSAVPTANQVPYGDGTKLVYTAGGSIGEVLGIGSSGNPEWMSNGSAPSGPATGDLSANYPNPTVAKINGTTITTAGGALLTGSVLRATGASAADWGAVDLGSANAVTGTLAKANLPAVTVYTDGTYANPSWITSLAGSKITGDITGNAANVTGVVAFGNGGTGWSTYSAGDMLYYGGGTLSRRAIGTTGQVLVVSGGLPTWASTVGASGSDFAISGRDVGTATTATIASATSSFTANTPVIRVTSTPAGNTTLTSTPTIAVTGITNGTRLTIINETANQFTLQDENLLANTKIQLGGVTQRTLSQWQSIDLVYSNGFWIERAVGGSGVVQSVGATNGLIAIAGSTASPTVGINGLTAASVGGTGQLPYFSAANTMAALSAGTAGQYLKSNGASAPAWADTPYDVAGMVAGLLPDNTTVFYFKATRAFILSATSTDHVFTAATGATATAVLTVYKNGATKLMDASFDSGGSSGSQNATIQNLGALAARTIAVGNIITVLTPTPADATLANVYWTLTGALS